MSRASRTVHPQGEHQSEAPPVEPRRAVDDQGREVEGSGDQGGERHPPRPPDTQEEINPWIAPEPIDDLEPPLNAAELRKLRKHMRLWLD